MPADDSGSTHDGLRLGFAVKVLGAGGLPSHDTRRWQSGPDLATSLDHLEAVLAYLDDEDIRFYRMATALAPYASHPDLPQFRDAPLRHARRLAEVGAEARRLGIRLTTHPGQYTVLNSEDERIRRTAAVELEVQAELMDGMGLGPEAVVILHVGGAAGGREAALDRFEQGFALLSDAARARLVLENDDRTFGLSDVLELSGRIGRPVVWDILHHHCHDPDAIPDAEALALALGTWEPGVRPKIHFSTARSDVEPRRKKVGRRVVHSLALPPQRAHADLVDALAFEGFLTGAAAAAGRPFDIMLEAKAKDLAVLRLREQLARRGHSWAGGYLMPSARASRRSPAPSAPA